MLHFIVTLVKRRPNGQENTFNLRNLVCWMMRTRTKLEIISRLNQNVATKEEEKN